ncbi:MAG TPA: HAMP domain-containing sensor histidine kinase [Chryseosolibacter sp.]
MHLTDDELVELLRSRLSQKKNTLTEVAMFRELEAVSAKLKQSEQMKSHFLSNIRNEINNPVASVLGLSKAMLQGETLDRQQLSRYAFLIHNEIFNLDFQMKNIFAAAEIEAGAMIPHPAFVDVARLLEEVNDALAFKIEKKRIDVDVDHRGKELMFCSDAYMIHLIALNLIANAIEFSLEGGRVEVVIFVSEEYLSLTIRDYGSGIDEKDHRKIFERFTQLDQGSTKIHAGQGLGLSIAKEVAEAMGGNVTLASAVGDGSEFSVFIPALQLLGYNSSDASENWNEFLFGNDVVL